MPHQIPNVPVANRFEILNQEFCREVLIESPTQVRNRNQNHIIAREKDTSKQRNGFPIDQRPENNVPIHVPGRTSYAGVVSKGKRLAVFGDSMINRFNRKEFYRLVKGHCTFKSFQGANSKDLNHYVLQTLNNVKPDVAMVHVGTNDVRKRKESFEMNKKLQTK